MCIEVCEKLEHYGIDTDGYNNHKIFDEDKLNEIKKHIDELKVIRDQKYELDKKIDDIFKQLGEIGVKHTCRRVFRRRYTGAESCKRCIMINEYINSEKEMTIDSVKFIHMRLKEKQNELKKEIKTVSRMLNMSDSDDDF